MRQRGAQRIVVTAVAAATAAAAVPTAAAAAPGPPGPPPGAGAGLPLPPAAGSEPGPPAPGPAVTLPASVAGPALVDGAARVAASGRLRLRLACARDGQATLTIAALGAGAVARAAYRCRERRATVALRTSRRTARRLARMRTAIGRLSLRQRGARSDVAVALGAGRRRPETVAWSDGGLQCASPGPRQAYLVAPNFTVTPPTTIDVRPWIAWYTDAGGWRWLGLRGVGASRWTRLTATPAGVAQWLGAAGALDPWTWGPITVPAGGVWAVGVFEVVYWYGGRPTYVWRTTSSHVTATTTGLYCAFP